LADLGQHEDAVRLLGAADVLRERHGHPRDTWQEMELRAAYAASERHCRDRAGTTATRAGAAPPSSPCSKGAPARRPAHLSPCGGTLPEGRATHPRQPRAI
jgi:hypothetical protein